MNVLLIRPNSEILSTPVPLGLGYIASALRESRGDRVEILDARNLRWPLSRVRLKVKEAQPDVVGISALNFDMRQAHALATAVRAEAPKAWTIMGGPYASSNRERILDAPEVDVVVYGEGEVTAVELLNALESGSDLSKVKGIVYRADGQAISTEEREPIEDLDRLSVAWDLINPPDYFKRFGRHTQNHIKHHHRSLSLLTSRGCPYRCIYCHNLFGKKFRARSAQSVLDELSMLADRYDVREVEFADDTFTQSLDRAKAICKGLIDLDLRLHLSLPNGIRGDRTDAELWDLMKDSGFFRVAFGVETASPRIQEISKKSIDLSRVEWSIRQAATRHIMATGYFIMGFPTETYEEMLVTADWAASSDLHLASFFYLNPFPNTEVARMVGKDFSSNDVWNYRGLRINISDATDIELKRANRYAYRRFYLSARRIARIMRVVPKNFKTAINASLILRMMLQDAVKE